MNKIIIYILLLPILFITSCVQKTQHKEIALQETAQNENLVHNQQYAEEIALYQKQLEIPLAVPTDEETAYGVMYDNELKGGWQLMGNNDRLIPFGSSKVFIFIDFYKKFEKTVNRKHYKLPKYDENTCFVVLYYWNPTVRRWIAEYNGGQQVGNTIHVAQLEGEFSKGEPYDIVHIIEPDGRRFVELRNHKVLKLDGRRFYKTLP